MPFYKIINSLISVFWDYISFLVFKISSFNHNKICIVDIDNTIANTWPSYLKYWDSEFERLINLKYFPDVISLIVDYKKQGYKIIFLSARHPITLLVTYRWLNKVIFKTNILKVILVTDPFKKIKFIKSINKTKTIIYIDDLSYNTENGLTLFYDKIIKEVSLLNIKYYDFEYLIKLQINIKSIT